MIGSWECMTSYRVENAPYLTSRLHGYSTTLHCSRVGELSMFSLCILCHDSDQTTPVSRNKEMTERKKI